MGQPHHHAWPWALVSSLSRQPLVYNSKEVGGCRSQWYSWSNVLVSHYWLCVVARVPLRPSCGSSLWDVAFFVLALARCVCSERKYGALVRSLLPFRGTAVFPYSIEKKMGLVLVTHNTQFSLENQLAAIVVSSLGDDSKRLWRPLFVGFLILHQCKSSVL